MGIDDKGQVFTPRTTREDEISFFELAALLWQQKLLIGLFTLLGLFGAVGYAYTVQPLYLTSLTITPAPLGSLGALVRELNMQPVVQNKTVFVQAEELSQSVASILKRNLMSQAVQQDFQQAQANGLGPVSLDVVEDRFRCAKLTQPSVHISCNVVVLSGMGPSNLVLKPFIEAYLQNVAAISVSEANDFLGGLGVARQLEAKDLYRIDSPAQAPGAPVKPKKTVLLAGGLVAGGLFGILLAISLNFLKTRRGIIEPGRAV